MMFKEIVHIVLAVALAAVLVISLTSTAHAADVGFAGVIPGAGMVHKQVVSIQEQRFHDIVRQQTDFSCGAAALATILNYAYGKSYDEAQVIDGLFKVANQKVARTKGFSLLDIKNYVRTIGMRGRGYKIEAKALKDIRIPTIVLLDIKGYKHFVVLKRTIDNWVYIADPVLGNKRIPFSEFTSGWNGVIFAVIGPGFDRESSLLRPQNPPTVARFGLGAPLSDAQLYEFGFTHADLF